MVNLDDKAYTSKSKTAKQEYIDKKIVIADNELDNMQKRTDILNAYKTNLLDKKPK